MNSDSATPVDELIIDPNTEVEYPVDELKDLRRCSKLSGFFKLCYKTTGVTHPTITRMMEEKTGRKDKVDAVRIFVKSFQIQMNKPIA